MHIARQLEQARAFYGEIYLEDLFHTTDRFASSTAVKHVLDQRAVDPELAVAYFYFDFKDNKKQLHQNLLRSLVAQLSIQSDAAYQVTRKLYSQCQGGQQQPSRIALEETLSSIISRLGSVAIIIDALDECTEREKLHHWLATLIDTKPKGFQLLITSRRERDIEDCLGSRVPCRISLESTMVDHDIALLIGERLRLDARLKKWPAAVKVEIMETLMKGANGM